MLVTFECHENQSTSDAVEKHDDEQKAMSKPFAAPRSELGVHPHDRLLAHTQTAFCETVESLKLLEDKIARSLGVQLLNEGVWPVWLSLARAACRSAHDVGRVLHLLQLRLTIAIILIAMLFRYHQRHARSTST